MKLYSTRGLVCLTFSILATSPQDALAQKSGKAQTSPALPMRSGFYTEGKMTCASAAGNNGGIVVEPRALSFWDEVMHVVRISRASGEYLLTERVTDEGGSHADKSKIRVINPTSFVRTVKYPGDTKEYSTTYRFCSSNTNPW